MSSLTSWISSLLSYMTGADLLPKDPFDRLAPDAVGETDPQLLLSPQSSEQAHRPARDEDSKSIVVHVPAGIEPGQFLSVNLPDGSDTVLVQVPPLQPGRTFVMPCPTTMAQAPMAVRATSHKTNKNSERHTPTSRGNMNMNLEPNNSAVKNAVDEARLEHTAVQVIDDVVWSSKLGALKGELAEIWSEEQTRTMIARFGGEQRCLQRYLSLAGGTDVTKAAAAIRATLAFRAETGADTVLETAVASGLVAKVQKYFASSYADDTAPDGSPILFWYAGKLDGNAIAADVTEAELKTFYVYWMELGLQKQRESLAKGLNPDGVVEVYDLYGTGISMLTSGGIRSFSSVLSLGQLHYPENLTKGFLINAPWFFSRGYGLVKPMLNEGTTRRLDIESGDGCATLLTMMTKRQLDIMLAHGVPRSSSWF